MNGTKGSRPALYKSQSPPINDFNFRSLCENTETYCVFAHIRASSGSTVTQVSTLQVLNKFIQWTISVLAGVIFSFLPTMELF